MILNTKKWIKIYKNDGHFNKKGIKKQETYQGKSKPERKDIISFLRNIGQTVPIRQKIKFN